MQIDEVAAEDIEPLMKRCHYLGTVPKNSTPCFAVIEDGIVVAAAAYGPLHMPKGPAGFLELRRLVKLHDHPVVLSKFLAKTLANLRKRGIPAIVTWADPEAGHHGGIYQATNWVYNEPRSYNWNSAFMLPDGSILNHRQVFEILGTSSKSKVRNLRPDWQPFLPAPKYRYVMPLNVSKQEALTQLRGIERPYPKPHGQHHKRPPHSQRQVKI